MALLLGSVVANGQLPYPRLDTAFPAGAKAGSEVEVAVTGQDLADLGAMQFDSPGLSAMKLDAQKFRVTVAPGCELGLHELRVVGKYGISTPRPFVVSDCTELIDSGTNHSRETAVTVPVPGVVHGRADADQRDTYKFSATKGETIHISCAAFALNSPMDPVVVVSDLSGRTLKHGDDEHDRDVQIQFIAPADGEYGLAVNDKLFGGGANHLYRLSIAKHPVTVPLRVPNASTSMDSAPPLDEKEPNDSASAAQQVNLPATVRGTFDTDWFTFQADAGQRLWIQVISDDDGSASDPVLTVFKVSRDAQGNDQTKQVLELDDQPDIAPGRWFVDSREPAGLFTPDESATFRIRVVDRFKRRDGGYRLVIRPASPDFAVVALPDSPANEEKKLFVFQPNARRGGSAGFPVAALRRGYDGEIRLRVEGLPDGITASGSIPAGAQTGWLSFNTGADAKPWAGFPKVIAEGGGVSRAVAVITYRWNVGNRDNERAAAHLSSLAVGSIEEPAPLAISSAEQRTYEATIGGSLEIPLKITRSGQPKGEWQIAPIGFPGLAKFEPIKIDGAAANDAKLVLSLVSKDGNNFVPGTYTFVLRARGVVAYRADEKAPPKDVQHVEFSTPITVNLSAPATASK